MTGHAGMSRDKAIVNSRSHVGCIHTIAAVAGNLAVAGVNVIMVKKCILRYRYVVALLSSKLQQLFVISEVF